MSAAAEYAGRAAGYSRLATRFLHLALFATVFVSPFVMFEPAPYEAMIVLMALGCVFTGATVDRRLLLPFFLIVLWNVGGLIALMPVVTDQDAITFIIISIYLGMSAMLFACLFAQDSVRRVEIMRNAYIATAVIASIIGIIGYFMRKFGYEPAPMVLGFILGPMLEEQFRRTLLLSDGDFTIFLTRPLSAALIGVTAFLLLLMVLPNLRKSRDEAFREQD